MLHDYVRAGAPLGAPCLFFSVFCFCFSDSLSLPLLASIAKRRTGKDGLHVNRSVSGGRKAMYAAADGKERE